MRRNFEANTNSGRAYIAPLYGLFFEFPAHSFTAMWLHGLLTVKEAAAGTQQQLTGHSHRRTACDLRHKVDTYILKSSNTSGQNSDLSNFQLS